MLPIPRRLLLGPLLALFASGAALVVEPVAAQAATTATIKVRGTLAARAAATSASAQYGRLKNKAKVSIACKVNGQYIKGNVRKTSQWDRLTNGWYVSHAYVQTSKSIPTCPPPPPPPAPTPNVSGPLTTVSNAAFLAAAAGPAQASQREFKVPASVTLAQAILESGWGRSKLSANDKNYFGMKCFNNSPGTIAVGCHNYLTTECDKVTLACWQIVDSFRIYNSPTDSFRDHGRQLATLTRYAAAFNYPRNPNQFAAEVHNAGYATDPAYTTKLVNLMTTYNRYQYDLP